LAPLVLIGSLQAADNASAILFNTDGAGLSHWTALRWITAGPDGSTHWDKLPVMVDYRNHVRDSLVGNSNAGCTIHAYGVKVGMGNSIGTDLGKPVQSLSGRTESVMMEARAAGKSIGLINTARLEESGTSAFVTRITNMRDRTEIARQVIEAAPDLILAGGETLLLPENETGKHGKPGVRKDGLNLITRARELGYTVVYTKDELMKTPLTAKKVLGVFAANELIGSGTEEEMKEKGIAIFESSAPTIAEMADFGTRFLSRNPKGFFLAMNEEGADNFSGSNNARAVLESLKRANEAIGVLSAFVARHPKTLLINTADAPSGGFTLLGRLLAPNKMELGQPLPPRDNNGAPIDGRDGTGTMPFESAPDRAGRTFPFAISWSTLDDVSGGVVVKAAGYKSNLVQPPFDNTDVYRVLYTVLIEKPLAGKR
jgi:alkaline phosphatase